MPHLYLFDEKNFLFYHICMCELSGNRNVYGILSASNNGTLLADYTDNQLTSSIQVKYKWNSLGSQVKYKSVIS